MAPSSIIVLDDSDSEDIQLITDDAADATFAGTEDQIVNGVTIVCRVIREFFEG